MSNISKLFMALCLVVFSASVALAGNDGGGKVKQPTITHAVQRNHAAADCSQPGERKRGVGRGTGGTFVVTTNGGKTWKSGVVPGPPPTPTTTAISRRLRRQRQDRLPDVDRQQHQRFQDLQNHRWRRDLEHRIHQRDRERLLRLLRFLGPGTRHRAQRFGEWRVSGSAHVRWRAPGNRSPTACLRRCRAKPRFRPAAPAPRLQGLFQRLVRDRRAGHRGARAGHSRRRPNLEGVQHAARNFGRAAAPPPSRSAMDATASWPAAISATILSPMRPPPMTAARPGR